MSQIHIEVKFNFIGQEGHLKKGMRLFVDEKRARYLIEKDLAMLVKPVGPAETKPAGPLEKKHFGAPMTTPSTDSPSSSAPGTVTPSASLQEAPASLLNKLSTVAKRATTRRRKVAAGSAPSPSTTAT